MSCLIIGCGYLGRRVARLWLDAGMDVTALTRSATRAEELSAEGIRPIIGDVTNAASLDTLPPVDRVVYAVGFDRDVAYDRRGLFVGGIEHVLEKLAGRVKRFLYVSSVSVYGQIDGSWVDETSECRPSRLNGQICLEAENVVRGHFESLPTDRGAAHVLRLAGIYGPGRILARADQLQSGTPLAGNPEAYLNLIHVDDAAQAVVSAAELAKPGETYLVCDDRPVTRREYYESLSALIHAPPPQFDVTASDGWRTAGLNKRCSNRKLREELAVRLRFPDISTGLPHAVGG